MGPKRQRVETVVEDGSSTLEIPRNTVKRIMKLEGDVRQVLYILTRWSELPPELLTPWPLWFLQVQL